MTLHIEDNGGAEANKEIYILSSYSFNLRDINPQSIRMSTLSHTGGFYCEAFPDANMDCDHAEILFKTRLEAPLIDEDWDVIYPKLQGSEHEDKGTAKANEAHFMVNDVEYAKRLTRAFRHAVELCGGKPEPF
jgi:hypothetical protein